MKKLIWLTAGTVALALVLLIGAALVVMLVPLEIDLTPYAAQIARELQNRAGLALRVDGPLALRTGPVLGVRAKDLHLRTTGGSKDADLLSSGRLAVEVQTLPLFSGVLQPRLLELEDARLRLDRDASGRGNWEARGADRRGQEAKEGEGLRLVADDLRLRVRNLSVDYADAVSGDRLQGRVQAADLEPSEDGLQVVLDASVNGHPWRLKGRTATPSRLIGRGEPLPVDLEGEVFGLRVQAHGNLVDPRTGAAMAAELRVHGESLTGLAPWLGDQVSKVGPVSTVLQVAGGKNRYRIERFDLSLGNGRFDGAATLDLEGDRPEVQLTLGVSEIDMRPFLKGRKELKARGGKPRGRKPAAERLDLGWMAAADLSAKVNVTNVVMPDATLNDTKIDVELLDRRLSIAANGHAQGGRAYSADLSLDGTADPPSATLRFKGEKLLIEPLVAMTEAEGLIRGDVDVSAKLNTTGNSAERMAAALEGDIVLLIERAEADVKGLDQLVGGVNALVGQLVTPGQKLAKVNCGLAELAFSGGRGQVKGLLDTPYSTVVAQGDLDFGTQTLSLRVSPTPKRATLSVASPVRVHGSLHAPAIEIEEGGLLLTLTDLVSKVALPQLLIVDAFGSAARENPCVRIAAGELVQEQYGTVGTVVKGAGTVLKGTGKVLEGVGDAVKGLFGEDP